MKDNNNVLKNFLIGGISGMTATSFVSKLLEILYYFLKDSTNRHGKSKYLVKFIKRFNYQSISNC
jgi:hypothetical protein